MRPAVSSMQMAGLSDSRSRILLSSIGDVFQLCQLDQATVLLLISSVEPESDVVASVLVFCKFGHNGAQVQRNSHSKVAVRQEISL